MTAAPQIEDYWDDLSDAPYRYIVMTHVEGASYDYRAQEWREFHDHYHTGRKAPGALAKGFCGADVGTCQNLPR